MNKATQKELLNIVKRNYEEIADHYSETRKKHLWPELEKLTQDIKPGSKVLDVGCGSGKLLMALENKNIRYLGIDQCKKLLNSAEAQFPSAKFNIGDILNLGEINELDYDYVFSIAVLQHIPGHDLQIKALRQLKNKISQNGKIIISTWNIWNQEKYRKLIWRFWLLKLVGKNKMNFGDILFDWKNPEGNSISKRYYHAFTIFELKRLIKKSGLKIERIYKDEFNIFAVLKK